MHFDTSGKTEFQYLQRLSPLRLLCSEVYIPGIFSAHRRSKSKMNRTIYEFAYFQIGCRSLNHFFLTHKNIYPNLLALFDFRIIAHPDNMNDFCDNKLGIVCIVSILYHAIRVKDSLVIVCN